MSNEKKTLSTGKYSIEFVDGGFAIFAAPDNPTQTDKEWIATAADPKLAMDLVEGLILVEMKRFYYPDSTPTVKPGEQAQPLRTIALSPEEAIEDQELPPFLKVGD